MAEWTHEDYIREIRANEVCISVLQTVMADPLRFPEIRANYPDSSCLLEIDLREQNIAELKSQMNRLGFGWETRPVSRSRALLDPNPS